MAARVLPPRSGDQGDSQHVFMEQGNPPRNLVWPPKAQLGFWGVALPTSPEAAADSVAQITFWPKAGLEG
jgi:hypothetical protein